MLFQDTPPFLSRTSLFCGTQIHTTMPTTRKWKTINPGCSYVSFLRTVQAKKLLSISSMSFASFFWASDSLIALIRSSWSSLFRTASTLVLWRFKSNLRKKKFADVILEFLCQTLKMGESEKVVKKDSIGLGTLWTELFWTFTWKLHAFVV